MSCANMYDWINQSEEHQRYALTNYPVAAYYARRADSYEEFITLVQDFRTGEAGAYQGEFQKWWQRWGDTWDKIGCIREYALGEHTQNFRFQATPTPNVAMRQRDYGAFTAEGPRLSLTGLGRLARRSRGPIVIGALPSSGLSCFGKCGPQHLGQTDPWEAGQSVWGEDAWDQAYQDETGKSDLYGDDPWSDSGDYDIGTPSMMPDLKSGYFWCSKPASQVKQVQAPKASSEAPGWTVAVYSGADNQLYYRYDHAQTNVRKWACPVSNRPGVQQKADIKLIQKALNSAGYPVGTVDGIAGSKTCDAAYKFQKERVGVMGADLTKAFYQALGLGGKDFEVKYARLCAMYHKEQYTTPDKPEPSTPPKRPPAKKDPISTPEPVKAGFPWPLAVFLGLGAGVTVFMTKKKKRR